MGISNDVKSASGYKGDTAEPAFTDEQLWDLWEEHRPFTSKIARITGYSQQHVRKRLVKIRADKGLIVEKVAVKAEQLLDSLPREIEGGGRLVEGTYSGWKQGAKDGLSQQMIENPLDAVKGRWKFDTPEKKWPEIATVVVKGYRSTQTVAAKYKRALFIGDTQFGFWAQLDPNDPLSVQFIPFHGDGRAIDAILQAIAIYKPDVIVIIGDFFDFPQFSRFQQEPGFDFTLQAAFCFGRAILALIRDAAGDACEIHFIPGNHETRLPRAVVNQMKALWEVRRPGETDPIHALNFILKLDELGVKVASEFPSGEVWVHRPTSSKPGLVATHAPLAGAGARHIFKANQVHGHLVLGTITTKPVFDYDEETKSTRPFLTWAACCSGTGNYSDTVDKIRLTRTMTPSGRAKASFSHSLVTVDINRKTDAMQPHLWLIDDGAMEFYDGTIVGNAIDPRKVIKLKKAA